MKKLSLTLMLSFMFVLTANATQTIYENGITPIDPGHEPPRMPYCGKVIFVPNHAIVVQYINVCGVTLNHCNSHLISEAQHLAAANPDASVSIRGCYRF